jgi:hypothetical protein
MRPRPPRVRIGAERSTSLHVGTTCILCLASPVMAQLSRRQPSHRVHDVETPRSVLTTRFSTLPVS